VRCLTIVPIGRHEVECMKSIQLLPGQFAYSLEPARVSAVLGSCVAVAIHDPTLKAGGMCHYLLPKAPEGESNLEHYGDFAVRALVRGLEELGSAKERMRAKVFGGATRSFDFSSSIGVGEANVEMALRVLGKEKIPIWECDRGGDRTRDIALHTHTFEVFHPRQITPEAAAKAGPYLKGKGVLLVDDNDDYRGLLGLQLLKLGAMVIPVADAASAIDSYHQNKNLIDCLVMDVNLSQGSDGIEVYRKIREMGGGSKPVVFISGDLIPEKPHEQSKLKQSFLQKPFTIDELQMALAAVTDAVIAGV
jgi:chemotaxis receptor (MCP) glutamine deamidase CheD/CheY-like chemotaxis protein